MAAIMFHNPVMGTVVNQNDRLYFYDAGTTDDYAGVYEDEALSIAHTNPILTNIDGEFGPIYLDSSADDPKVVLTSNSGSTRWTIERYPLEDLAALSSSVSDLETDVATVEGSLSTLQTSVTNNANNITTNTANIATNTSAIAANTAAIAGLTGGGGAAIVAAGVFNMDSEPTYEASFGLNSTIQRAGAGEYTITFDSAEPDSNYLVIITVGAVSSNFPLDAYVTNKTNSTFDIISTSITGGGSLVLQDREHCQFVVYRIS